MATPLYLFSMLWKKRNRAAFEDETPFVHRMKATFGVPCGRGQNCSVDNTDSLVDFLAWLGYR